MVAGNKAHDVGKIAVAEQNDARPARPGNVRQ